MEDFLLFTDHVLSASSASHSSTHPGWRYAEGSGIFFVLDHYNAGHMLIRQSSCVPIEVTGLFLRVLYCFGATHLAASKSSGVASACDAATLDCLCERHYGKE